MSLPTAAAWTAALSTTGKALPRSRLTFGTGPLRHRSRFRSSPRTGPSDSRCCRRELTAVLKDVPYPGLTSLSARDSNLTLGHPQLSLSSYIQLRVAFYDFLRGRIVVLVLLVLFSLFIFHVNPVCIRESRTHYRTSFDFSAARFC